MKSTVLEGFGEIIYDEEKHILRTVLKNKANIDAEIAKHFVDKALELTGTDKFGTVSDLRKMVFVSRDGRRIFAKYRNENLICVGAVIDSKLQRSIVNLFMKFSNPDFEIKFFTDLEKAKDWVEKKVAEYYSGL